MRSRAAGFEAGITDEFARLGSMRVAKPAMLARFNSEGVENNVVSGDTSTAEGACLIVCMQKWKWK